MSAIKVESGLATPQVTKSADGPRKRRKRAPVAGAADDCFTCSNRHAKCDRRRPYCSTCLESGQDCAGYKTQLTWGVGVASRGKLRGLSLPVAGTKKVAEPASPPKKKRTASPTQAVPLHFAADKHSSLPLSPESTTGSTFKPQRPTLSATLSEYQRVRPQPPKSRHSVSGPISNGVQPELLPSPASTHMATSPIAINWPSTTSMQAQGMYHPSPVSPISYSTPSHNASYLDHMPQNYHEPYSTMDSYPSVDAVMNPMYMSDTYSSHPVHSHSHHHHREQFEPLPDTFQDLMQENQISALSEDDVEEISREDASSASMDALSLSSSPLIYDLSINWTPLSGVNAIGSTPRMQYLIQYYTEVIAPVIVAFDSPTNPFRDRILNLAAKSDSLQHALSALAASNLRQRKESGALSTGKTAPARRSSAAHVTLTNRDTYSTPIIPIRGQRREEVYHKYHAVQALNAALADPHLLKDDAVLATLLVLCLFHICDSGIARFQTQFAGVKKLLNLRKLENGADDSNTRWMTRLFTWFDAMAATVNEREGQFGGQILESSASSDEEWSYETLAGVDGRLFKTMSQLGRLNILSQGKPVESTPNLISRPLPFMDPAHAPNHVDFNTFDGNGWMRIVDDENFFNMKTMADSHDFDHSYQHNAAPKSEQFWREWREVRQQLQTWNLDKLLYETSTHPNGPHLSEEQCLDIDNISNAFRYSALLYTERLGQPMLPSSHEKIQYWVRRSLHHIKRVRSDVYLLWPLFITGSECVHEEGRNTIRERCEDIQKDSGFVNNASCLALLEKVWNVVPIVSSETSPSDSSTQRQTNGLGFDFGAGGDPFGHFQSHEQHLHDSKVDGFRFRDVMRAENNKGEWIVV